MSTAAGLSLGLGVSVRVGLSVRGAPGAVPVRAGVAAGAEVEASCDGATGAGAGVAGAGVAGAADDAPVAAPVIIWPRAVPEADTAAVAGEEELLWG